MNISTKYVCVRIHSHTHTVTHIPDSGHLCNESEALIGVLDTPIEYCTATQHRFNGIWRCHVLLQQIDIEHLCTLLSSFRCYTVVLYFCHSTSWIFRENSYSRVCKFSSNIIKYMLCLKKSRKDTGRKPARKETKIEVWSWWIYRWQVVNIELFAYENF